MSAEDKVNPTAIAAAVGAAAGTATGLANAAAPHVHRGMRGAGVLNASSNFFNGATKAFKNHKGVAGALGAGTTAVIGHGALATAAVAAAPVAAVTAVAGCAIFGAYKLFKHIRNEW